MIHKHSERGHPALELPVTRQYRNQGLSVSFVSEINLKITAPELCDLAVEGGMPSLQLYFETNTLTTSAKTRRSPWTTMSDIIST